MEYGGGGLDVNCDLSSLSSSIESWIEQPDPSDVIRPESVEERRLGLPAKQVKTG